MSASVVVRWAGTESQSAIGRECAMQESGKERILVVDDEPIVGESFR